MPNGDKIILVRLLPNKGIKLYDSEVYEQQNGCHPFAKLAE